MTILIFNRINDVLEQQVKHTRKTNKIGKNFLEQHPPKEVGLHTHSMNAKTKSLHVMRSSNNIMGLFSSQFTLTYSLFFCLKKQIHIGNSHLSIFLSSQIILIISSIDISIL